LTQLRHAARKDAAAQHLPVERIDLTAP
jgi:hypothetical protein